MLEHAGKIKLNASVIVLTAPRCRWKFWVKALGSLSTPQTCLFVSFYICFCFSFSLLLLGAWNMLTLKASKTDHHFYSA